MTYYQMENNKERPYRYAPAQRRLLASDLLEALLDNFPTGDEPAS